jgi:hypothetical protein
MLGVQPSGQGIVSGIKIAFYSSKVKLLQIITSI